MGEWSIRRKALQEINNNKPRSKYLVVINPKLKEISSKDIPSEYNKLVNDNIWSLI